MAAADGQTLGGQSEQTQADYRAVYGDNAESQWEADHNAAIGAGGGGGSNNGGNDNSGGGGNSNSNNNNNSGNSGVSYSNPQNDANALSAANLAAQIAYNKAKLKQDASQFKATNKLDQERERLAEATQAWVKTYQSALLTGTIDGQPTTAWLATQAQLTGYFNGAPTLEREKQDADNVFRTAQLLASLRGPKNAFQMSKVITNGGLQGVLASASGKYGLPTFGGGNGQPQPVTLQSFLSDASQGITGQEGIGGPYVPGVTQPTVGAGQYGYGSGNSQVASMMATAKPTPVLSGVGDVTAQQAGPQTPPLLVDQPKTSTVNTALGAISYSPPGVTAPSNQYNYQGSPDGNSYVYPPGATAPSQAAQLSSSTPQDPTALHQATGGGLYGYGSVAPTTQATAAPSTPIDASVSPPLASGQDNGQLQPYQLNARTMKGLNPYNKDLLWAYYESLGWDPAAAEAEFNASLPQYGGPQFGRVAGVV